MRDAIQSEQTQGAVLGNAHSASPAEIDKAFMQALARRVPASKAKAARDALHDPVVRAWHRLTQYRPEATKNTDGKSLSVCPMPGRKARLGVGAGGISVVIAGATPLYIAARNGHKDVAELLRQYGGHEYIASQAIKHLTWKIT